MNVLDLFSGIGGFSLGLERAGMRTIAFCEIDPYCRAVLRKHWPGVPVFEDVQTLKGTDVSGVDVIAGGFPCQDISIAGNGAGIEGWRSRLWHEYARLVREIRPKFVIVENVSALLGRGIAVVLGELSEAGYDAEWHCIPASAVGAPHLRDRVWIIAYPNGSRQQESLIESGLLAEAKGSRAQWNGHLAGSGDNTFRRWGWEAESVFRRMDDGLPNVMDRLKSLGNAVVPQIPEIIGRAIMKARTEVATA